MVEPIPEYTAREEHDDVWNWRPVDIAGITYHIDMKAIEPYRRVLSHGGQRLTSSPLISLRALSNFSLYNRYVVDLIQWCFSGVLLVSLFQDHYMTKSPCSVFTSRLLNAVGSVA